MRKMCQAEFPCKIEMKTLDNPCTTSLRITRVCKSDIKATIIFEFTVEIS